jgi:hypothetical protein
MPTGVYLAIGFVVLLAAVVFVSRKWGKSSAKADIAGEAAKRQAKLMEVSNAIEREVDAMPIADARRELYRDATE